MELYPLDFRKCHKSEMEGVFLNFKVYLIMLLYPLIK